MLKFLRCKRNSKKGYQGDVTVYLILGKSFVNQKPLTMMTQIVIKLIQNHIADPSLE